MEEFRLLTRVFHENPVLNDLVTVRDDSSVILDLDRDTAENFRDLLTERLAEIGFDSEYKPTQTGQGIEALIDKLFQP